MPEYNKPQLGIDNGGNGQDSLIAVAAAGVYLYVGALTTFAVETIAAVHAGTVLWTGAWVY